MLFPYPIGVLAFNRPDYARPFAVSLAAQTLPVDVRRVVVHVDGYEGSRDSSLAQQDRTDEVASILDVALPGAELHRSDTNLGIARSWDRIERAAFALPHSQWAVFFEDDFVLSPTYLESLLFAIRSAESYDEVVCVSASGNSDIDKGRGQRSYYPMHYAWGHAVRRTHWLERAPVMDAYLNALGDSAYRDRNNVAIHEGLAAIGVFPVATAQDAVKEAARRWAGRVAVTTGEPFGAYIGAEGESFTPQMFERQGHGGPVPQPAPWHVELNAATVAEVRHEADVSFAMRASRNFVAARDRAEARIRRQSERIDAMAQRIERLQEAVRQA